MGRRRLLVLAAALAAGLAAVLIAPLFLRPHQEISTGPTTYIHPGLAALGNNHLDPRYRIEYWKSVRSTTPDVWRQALAACGTNFDTATPNCVPVLLVDQTDQLASLISQTRALEQALPPAPQITPAATPPVALTPFPTTSGAVP